MADNSLLDVGTGSGGVGGNSGIGIDYVLLVVDIILNHLSV